MEIRRIPIEAINPAPYNPRKDLRPGDPEYEKLKRSLEEFGFVEPLVWNQRTGNLVGGHQRLSILKAQGLAEVECSVVDLDEIREKALNIALNKISGEWDDEKLRTLLVELGEQGFDLAITGFDDAELDTLLASTAALPDRDHEDDFDFEAAVDAISEPITRLGDVWILGRHRLMCGDSTKVEDALKLMNGERAALMATDPPYLVDYTGGNHPESWSNRPEKRDKHWDSYNEADAPDFFRRFITIALEHALAPGVAIYQWHAARRQALVEHAWIDKGLLFHQQIIWVKSRAVLTRSHFMWQHEPCFYGWVQGNPPALRPPTNATTVWIVDQKGEQDGIHPTQKPVKLFSDPMEWHLAPGDLAFEPFTGSGTAIIAAEVTGRRCDGMELSPVFCDAIIQRWEAFTGRKAVREG